MYFLPSGLSNPRMKSFYSAEPFPPLSESLLPLTEIQERSITEPLIEEINDRFGVTIEANLFLEYRVGTQADNLSDSCPVVMGMSHMCRLAEPLPANTIVCENNTVVMDLLSNVTFLGPGEDGLPSPTFHVGEGRFHVPSSLSTTLPTSVRKLWKFALGWLWLWANQDS